VSEIEPINPELLQRRPGVRCPYCGVIMTCSKDDIEMDLEARVIIGDWRCENGHIQRIVGVIHVEGDDED